MEPSIKLDQFTLLMSNITKINHKCRDIYLFYKRLVENIEGRGRWKDEKISEGISVKELVNILSMND